MNRKLATKTKNTEYLYLIIGLVMSFIAGFIGLIYGDFKTGLLMLIICTIVLFFIGHFSIQHNRRNELKIDILEYIESIEIPNVWWSSFEIRIYLKFRYVYAHFKNEKNFIKCI